MNRKKLSESFSKSVSQRSLKKDDSNKILGSEIRLNRNDLELTLKNLAFQTCSVSYISKVETNSIDARPQYLSEICEKVNISLNDIDKLKEAKNTCYKLIELVYYSRQDEIKEIFEEIKIFKNFRHLIIDLYYYFYAHDYQSFEVNSAKIVKILSTLNDIDFSLYGYICAKYQIELNNAEEATKILEELESYGTEDPRLATLINYSLLELYFKSNNIKFFSVYDNIMEFSKKTKDVIYVQKTYDLEKMFFIQNKLINQLPNIYIDISNEFSDLYNDFKILSNTITTYKIVFDYITKNIKGECIDKHDQIFMEYMALKDKDVYKSVEYLLKEALPFVYKENFEFYITFFTYELENFYRVNSTYKRYFEVENDYKDYLAKKYK